MKEFEMNICQAGGNKKIFATVNAGAFICNFCHVCKEICFLLLMTEFLVS